MITLIHRVGENACGHIAFWYDDDGAPADMIDANRVVLPDGSTPEKYSKMICGHCGLETSPAALDALPGKFEEAE